MEALADPPTKSISRRVRALSLSSGSAIRVPQTAGSAMSSRELQLQADLNMARRQLSLLPALRTSFDALIGEHAASKKRYSEKTATLTKSLRAEEEKAKLTIACAERLRAENLAKSREVGRLGEEMANLRSQKGDTEQALDKATEANRLVMSDKDAVQAEYRLMQEQYAILYTESRQQSYAMAAISSATLQQTKSSLEERNADSLVQVLALQYATFRAERKQGQAYDQINELVDLVNSLEDADQLTAQQLTDANLEIEQLRWELERCQANARQERMEHKGVVLDLRKEGAALRDDILQMRAENRIEASVTRSLAKESRLYRKERDLLEVVLRESCLEKLDLATRLQQSEAELEIAAVEIEGQNEALAKERGRVGTISQQAASLTEQLEATTGDLREAEIGLQAHRQQLDESLTALTAVRKRETTLQAELASLQDDLTEYHVLQERHEDLQKMLDRVLRTSNLAEEDAAELARINADLAGHANPNQKIRHLERLRNELAASKKNLVGVQAELSSALRQNESLQTEINAYKSIDAPPLRHLQASRAHSNSLAQNLHNGSTTRDMKSSVQGPGMSKVGRQIDVIPVKQAGRTLRL